MVYLIWILAIIATTGLLLMVPTDNIITGNNILTLIGICTTLIVGVHVHDAFTIRAISKKTELLDEKLKHIEMLEHRDEVHLKISLGLTQLQYQPYTTFRFIFKGFVLAANYKDYKCMEQCLGLLEQVPGVIQRLKAKNMKVNKKGENEINYDLINQITDNEIRNQYERRLKIAIKNVTSV